jgi:two-component system response regulator NreC
MSSPLRVLIADDHTIVRSGIRLLLETEPGIEVVAEALNGKQALALAELLNPNLILMDIAMPEMDGLEATRRIKELLPEINILILTMHRSDEYFFELLKAGASGYILKTADTDELIQAVHATANGEVFLHPSMAKKLLGAYLVQSDEKKAGSDSPLSARENEILLLLAQGYSNKEIAEKLVVSPSTVNTHRSNLMSKLGLNTRRELIQYARQRDLI